MDPAVPLVGDVGDLAHRVEGAGVDVADLRADDRRPFEPGERGAQRVRPHAALAVGGDADDAPAAEAEHAQRGQDGDVRLVPDHDVHRGSTGESVLLHVPVRALEHRVAASGEAGEIRHLPARHEADAGGRRQREQVEQPARRHFLDDRRRRPAGVEAGILVPGRRQPVGGEGRGQAAADDEAEVAGPGAGHQTGLGRGGEVLDDRGGVGARRGERSPQRGAQRGQVGPRPHGAVGKRLQEAAGEAGDAVEKRLLAHPHPRACIDTILPNVFIRSAHYP